MQRRVYVAHDIEKAGVHMIKYPVVSVGFVVADDIDVIEKRQFNISVDWYENVDNVCVKYGDFEKRTVDEFWNRVPIDPRGMQADAKPVAEAWAEIRAFIDQLETEYADAEIIFLTDNNSFDTANIDYNLELHTGRAPMRFSTSGAYRAVLNADDMFSMMPERDQQKARKQIAERVTHSHNPVDDAQYIYELYIFARTYRAPYRLHAEDLLNYMIEQNDKNQDPSYSPTLKTSNNWEILDGVFKTHADYLNSQWHMTDQQVKTEQDKPKNRAAWLANYAAGEQWDMSCTPNDSPPGTPRAPANSGELDGHAKCNALLAEMAKKENCSVELVSRIELQKKELNPFGAMVPADTLAEWITDATALQAEQLAE